MLIEVNVVRAPRAHQYLSAVMRRERLNAITEPEEATVRGGVNMVTFDSPVYRCEGCGEFVLMDQTVRECSEEHQCNAADCPVLKFFEGRDFRRNEQRQRRPGNTKR